MNATTLLLMQSLVNDGLAEGPPTRDDAELLKRGAEVCESMRGAQLVQLARDEEGERKG